MFSQLGQMEVDGGCRSTDTVNVSAAQISQMGMGHFTLVKQGTGRIGMVLFSVNINN